jgi:hypothetical protein
MTTGSLEPLCQSSNGQKWPRNSEHGDK